MRIAQIHSHFNGLEFMLMRKPNIWAEVTNIVKSVHAKANRKASARRLRSDYVSVKSARMASQFEKLFCQKRWQGYSNQLDSLARSSDHVDSTLLPKPECCGDEIESTALRSGIKHTFCLKDRVSVEVQFCSAVSFACPIFAKHLASYVGDRIDVGIEILPMKSLQARLGSGVICFEDEYCRVIPRGCNVPVVPLVFVGIE